MKEMFMIQIIDIHVDAAYDVHVEAHVLPEVYTSYKKANDAFQKALMRYRDASLICVDPTDEDGPRAYGEPVEADYVK